MKIRVFAAVVAFLTLVPAISATAQDPVEMPADVLDALGVTLEDVLAAEPNPAWDNLGLFSPDAQRILEVAGQPAEFITYAFGDDPNESPVISPTGATPTERGTMLWQLPDDWTPPTEGLTDTMAFAQTQSSQLAPGDTVVFMWVELDSDYDFTSGLTINEGFPLTIPGNPVWNSSFAGDTWEGSNLIPNAVFENGVLTLDVKMYEPPQSFPTIDLPSFYYRSGNVMAMALSADALVAQVDAAGQESASIEPDGGSTSDLLYRGTSDDFFAQASPLAVLAMLLAKGWTHLAERLFSPGFIFLLTNQLLFIAITTVLLTNINLLTPAPPAEPEPAPTPDPDPAASDPESTSSDPPEVPEQPESTPDETPSPTTTTTTPDDGGSGGLFLILILVGMILLFIGLWMAVIKPRLRPKPESTTTRTPGTSTKGPPSDGTTYTIIEEDDDPRDTPPPAIYGEEVDHGACDWELHFNSGGSWTVLREAAAGRQKCCIYKVEIESKAIFHAEVASFRQDVGPERLYIPDLATSTAGMNYFSSSSTRSGPLGRQDWQHGYGNPTDQTALGDPAGYWQQGQGEERPELVAQMAHIELSRVKVTLDSDCAGHENTYNVSADGGVSVLSTQECTNDNPGPACPVELNAYGAHMGLAIGDLNLGFIEATGTDIDELERLASALKDMGPEELERAGNPPIPVIGRWDSHDHEVRDRMTYENTEDDTGHPIKTGDTWETYFVTVSVHFAGQLVPVSVWETTERVSAHIQAGFDWNLTLTGEMEKKPCDPGPCAGHPDLTCHTQPGFVLRLSGDDNSLQVDGKTFDLSRPVFEPPDGLSIPRITTFWDSTPSRPIGMP